MNSEDLRYSAICDALYSSYIHATSVAMGCLYLPVDILAEEIQTVAAELGYELIVAVHEDHVHFQVTTENGRDFFKRIKREQFANEFGQEFETEKMEGSGAG